MIAFLASHQHASDRGIINLKLGCVKDHLGSHEPTWTPSGILDSSSDMIANCQVNRPGKALGSMQKFLPPLTGAYSPAVAKAGVTKVRASDAIMGANLKDLRDRIGSVKNTKKITSAMKLVAAAKVRRAQEAVIRQRPFSESLERILGGLLKRAQVDAPDIPLLAERKVNKVGLVVISGDRGLCGSYNAAVIKKAEARIRQLKASGVEVELILVGNKCGTYFKRRDTPIKKMSPVGGTPGAEQSIAISNELLASYYAGDFDRVELIYTNFISMIASEPTIRTLIPLLPDGMEMEGDEVFKLTTQDGKIGIQKEKQAVAEPMEIPVDMIFEQDPAALLDSILKLYLNGQLLRTLQESVASELASRMTAMQSATDNASDLQGRLEIEYNKGRQAKITQELMEIVAGADASG
jgi:F-type H+-transporting ATPase subunit gamma